MTILIRFILISLIFYLIIRSFRKFWEVEESEKRRPQQGDSKISGKGVSKDVGEYVDYEEVD
jgi:large-conductance mechanosensitive channel